MKIGFVFTNFNNSKYTVDLLESLSKLEPSVEIEICKIIIIDNNSEESEKKILRKAISKYELVHLIESEENLGYFKGLNLGINYLKSLHETDVMIIGNNDLFFESDFLENIYKSKNKIDDNLVVSPDIITLDGIHQNPHVIKDLGRLRLFVLDLFYLNYNLALLIKWISIKTKKITERTDYKFSAEARFISEGYGACYILGSKFFKNFNELWSPTFLMGEEFFLKKQLESKGFFVYYEPTIKVLHHDHAAVGNLPKRKFWEISKESHLVYKKIRAGIIKYLG